MKKITASYYRQLQQELHYLVKESVISEEQREEALQKYEIKEGLSTLSIILAIGAILIGLGVLIAVSTNWSHFSLLLKFSILFVATLTSYVVAFALQHHFEKTARAFYYIAAFITGASLYFIASLYTNQIETGMIALLWAVTLIPLVLFLVDLPITLLFAGALFLSSIGYATVFSFGILLIFPLIAFLMWVNEVKLKESKLGFISVVAVLVTWIAALMSSIDVPEIVPISFIFILGIALFFNHFEKYFNLSRWLGTIIISITSLSLMGRFTWQAVSENSASIYSTSFTIAFAIFAFALLKYASLQAIVFIGILISRLYFDYTFDLIPQSLFFVIAGLLMIGFGYWFERTRRNEGQTHA